MNTAKNNYSVSGLQTHTSGIEMPQDFKSCGAEFLIVNKGFIDHLLRLHKIVYINKKANHIGLLF